LSEVYAVAKVPEYFVSRIKPGTEAHIKVVALPDEKFDGKLIRFGTSADEESGTIDAIFILPNKSGRLRQEMRAEFSVVLDSRPNVLSVPRAALHGEASNRFVYVKHFDLPNAFVKTSVQTGKINDSYVEIEGGLFPGDEVVTRGGYSLSFAGASSISLKEALDAAHGHEHAEDGSELTPEKKAEMEAKKRAEAGLPAEDAHESPLWKIVSGVLFVLLLASLLIRKGPDHPEEPEVSKSNPGTH
jgi:membrane fusion protein, heavy metal efflux system